MTMIIMERGEISAYDRTGAACASYPLGSGGSGKLILCAERCRKSWRVELITSAGELLMTWWNVTEVHFTPSGPHPQIAWKPSEGPEVWVEDGSVQSGRAG
jgi:hypothetical protein